jgi:D-inositol-3-phosphate glycosyltransferase
MSTSDTLRVAILSVHACPLAILGGKKTGGMNVYIRDLSMELSKHGIFVDIFTRSEDQCVPHVNDTELRPCGRVIHVPAGPEHPVPIAEIYNYLPEFVDGVQDFAHREALRYDVIYSHYWLSGWVALQLKPLWRVPVIQMFHTLGRMKNRVSSEESQREPERRIQVEHQIIESADCLIAATPAERTQLMWLYGADMHKIRIIPPGVDISHFHPISKVEAKRIIGIPENAQMLLFVGRIEPLKGIDTLFHAIAILRSQIPQCLSNLCLSIIGGEPERDEQDNTEMQRLKALREELGLAELVTFLGAKSQETLHYYYTAAEAVIMPSHYESFGMVALEAMACGTPVIASEIGGLAYLIQDGVTGFHVPDRDPDELAGKMCLLLKNDELRREMSVAAVQHAQQYAWPQIAMQLKQVFLKSTGELTTGPSVNP